MMKGFTVAAWVAPLATLALFAQNENSSLQGFVRDSQGKPVAAATVQLKIAGQTFTASTDAQGNYRFGPLRAGSYTLHASETGLGEADLGPFSLEQQESKKVDLVLKSSAKPQFFDEPTFIVAGVTDPSLRGGHGSDPVLRSTETLAKSTASLRTDPSVADAAEKQGKALEAAREFQRMAELDPTETHLFDWGAELLIHHAADQAVEVFSRGNRLFPRSTRMLLGLAVALYSRGSYDQSVQRFFEAADLNPSDPAPYLFLGKVSSGAVTESPGYAERLRRFASLQPENAWANYYYAASLWKRRAAPPPKIQSLLEKAVRLDPHLGAAFLQLGIIFAEQGKLSKAISAYQSAIDATPPMEEAHYRLAQAYRKTGEPAKAQKEIELYQQLSKQSAQELERERSEIQQFVFELRKP
ncbi:MAG TPA: carboxypeptidase regulatory-like domain-containing protein [Bryobacteraceae bacterium]|jgi:tetratricopeptide (TPR) repeat protein|nr:carboxypeptidase regulatory-like domain-containing protein [Bryobacteraceae bacterium]